MKTQMNLASLWIQVLVIQITSAYNQNNSIIRIVSSIGPCSCKLECFSSSDCASVYYDWQYFNCELSSYNGSITELNSSFSYHFFSMHEIKQEFTDPCSGVRCAPHEKCVSTNNGIECVITASNSIYPALTLAKPTKDTGCGEPQDVPCTLSGSIGSSLSEVGTVRVYDCEAQGGKLKSMCQPNGLWSNVTEYYECPDSFHHDLANRLCVLIFNDDKNWDDADNECRSFAQRLVNINTPAQVAILKDYLKSLKTLDNGDKIYVGGRRINGSYIWMVTNQTIDSNVWDTDYPNSMKECTYLHDAHKLRNGECTQSYKYACGAFY